MEDYINPFGNPDGSRADIEDVLGKFVTFGGRAFWGGLATSEKDLMARVIVGRKGSGKTVYLRRLQAYSKGHRAIYAYDSSYSKGHQVVYADDIQQDLPTTGNIIRFCNFYKEPELTEKWMQLWRIAILRSLVCHLLYAKELNKFLSDTEKEQLMKLGKHFVVGTTTAKSVYSQVKEIINKYSTLPTMENYINESLWHEIENVVGDIIKNCPPICFYIDAVDEEFGHAPMYWLRCQKGLFYQVMRFLRDAKLGNRLHITICIRDIVLSSVHQSEHSTRYVNEPHIRVLKWNIESAIHFLKQKLSMLDDNFFLIEKPSQKNASEWLGVNSVTNGRSSNESIYRYLIRHTRNLPRDIVILGNNLADEVIKAKKIGLKRINRNVLRKVVSSSAAIFAKEEIKICANQITSDQMPPHAAAKEYEEVYTSSKEYIRNTADDLVDIIKKIGKDRFRLEELKNLEDECEGCFGTETDVFSILWQHGLLGYVEKIDNKECSVFYNYDEIDRFNIPRDKQDYIFHDTLLHYPGNLQFVGDVPLESID